MVRGIERTRLFRDLSGVALRDEDRTVPLLELGFDSLFLGLGRVLGRDLPDAGFRADDACQSGPFTLKSGLLIIFLVFRQFIHFGVNVRQ
jgi:hypothetical protein